MTCIQDRVVGEAKLLSLEASKGTLYAATLLWVRLQNLQKRNQVRAESKSMTGQTSQEQRQQMSQTLAEKSETTPRHVESK